MMHFNFGRSLLSTLLALSVPVVHAAAQTPDSALAVKAGGNSLFRVNVNGGTTFGGNYDGGTSSGGIPAEGAGTRLMWYPEKASVRAGYIDGTQWDDANIGYFSVAVGQNVRASGDNSTVFGLRSTAAGSSTFAVGEDNTPRWRSDTMRTPTCAKGASYFPTDRRSIRCALGSTTRRTGVCLADSESSRQVTCLLETLGKGVMALPRLS